ncbi:conserved Plasmodium protein, unknown function [Plasmodium gallinaceum]|uniref:THUMP domain-containing protein n=1 Tax=Plasmodium gallinaceum TaxID=5849 RepID=A0A1J1GXU1_PLAGA|nr:conserved Plasmodium protein, unknown function [Plasmodium gallinaceum]CRG97118.1 conserved Plasmodium protein, unknown function [Plasmodium gallinaceum]
MEYEKVKRTNQFIFCSSKHASKRRKILTNNCKGILISPVNPRKMGAAIKEFLNFLKINYPNSYENDETEDNENNVKFDSEMKSSNVEKQLNDEISKINSAYNRFSPLRYIVKNFALIKFNDINDKNPSDIVTQIFLCVQKKNEKYRLRNICKIIPFDYICKPHLSPFIKTILPLIKENFIDGICAKENFTVSHIMKLLNITGEKEKEPEEIEIEGETKNEDTEEKNGYNEKEIKEKEDNEKEIKDKEDNEKKIKDNEDNEKEIKDNEDNEKEIKDNEDNEKENSTKGSEDNEKEYEEKEDSEKKNATKKNEDSVKENEERKNEDNEKKIQNTTKDIKNKSNKKVSWGLVYKCSNTKTLTKKDVLAVLDNCIGNNYCVNLTKPDLAIVVYVNEIMCGISIIKDYDKTRKFNISSFNEDS